MLPPIYKHAVNQTGTFFRNVLTKDSDEFKNGTYVDIGE